MAVVLITGASGLIGSEAALFFSRLERTIEEIHSDMTERAADSRIR